MNKITKGRMRLQDLEKLRDCNELDLIYRMSALLKECEVLAEKSIKGNKTAMVELRKQMHDSKNLALVLRDAVGIRSGILTENKTLNTLISDEKNAIQRENGKRKSSITYEQLWERVLNAKKAEEIRRKEREQKKQAGSRTASGERKEAEDQL